MVNVHDAKTNLSKLLDRAAAGEEIVIARAGRPIARLVPLEGKPEPRRLGILQGTLRVPEDFNDPLPDELLSSFEQ